MESGPYLFPGIDLGFLFVASFGELIFLVWLAGWGIRLREPIRDQGPIGAAQAIRHG